MKIFIINGQGGAGKTSFENMVSTYAWKMDRKKIGICSMVDKIKMIAMNIGWTGSKEDKDRKFLSDLKDLCDKYNDLSYSYIKERIKEYKENNFDILFIDARQIEDINRLKKEYNAKTVIIQRGEPKNYGNHADDEVFNYNYDIIIDNNFDLENLKREAKIFYLKEILNGN